jgi:hypothetical protein
MFCVLLERVFHRYELLLFNYKMSDVTVKGSMNNLTCLNQTELFEGFEKLFYYAMSRMWLLQSILLQPDILLCF